MRRYGKKFWHSVPFIRLLIPLTAGIVLSHHLLIPFRLLGISLFVAIVILFLIRFSSRHRYQLRWLNGAAFNLVFICLGCLLIHFQNIKNDQRWVGHYLSRAKCISVILQEPLTAKTN